MWTWYLFSVLTGAYVGPMPVQNCVQAEKLTQDYGVKCRQAIGTMACAIDGRTPGSYAACPVFEPLPKVMIK